MQLSNSSLLQNHQWKQDLKHQELRVATIAALSQQIKGKKEILLLEFNFTRRNSASYLRIMSVKQSCLKLLRCSMKIWHTYHISIIK